MEFLLAASAKRSPRGFDWVLFNPTQFLYEMFCSHLHSLPPLPRSSGQAQTGRMFVFVFSGCSFLLSDVLQGGHLILPLYLAVSSCILGASWFWENLQIIELYNFWLKYFLDLVLFFHFCDFYISCLQVLWQEFFLRSWRTGCQWETAGSSVRPSCEY